MLTAQGKLDQTLISWYELLSGWAADGSLASTAEHILNLEGENAIEGADDLLHGYASQWSLGDFESLPPIVLLSNEDISGAQGAYAASTGTIYLNEDLLSTATNEQIIAVLTEELGAFLDDQLNTVDTQGDEGALFSEELLGAELSDAKVAAIQAEDDSVQITVDGLNVEAEANTSTDTSLSAKNNSSYLSLDPETGDYLKTNKFYIPEAGDFTVSLWARLDPLASLDVLREIISQGQSGTNGFYIGINKQGDIRLGDSWGGWETSGIAYPNDGDWHNFQLVKSGSSASLYIDGNLVGSKEEYLNPLGGDGLAIGNQFQFTRVRDEYWDGDIDDIYIFNRVLSVAELEQARISNPPNDGQVFSASFDDSLVATDQEGIYEFETFGSPSLTSDPSPVIRGNSLYTIVEGFSWTDAKTASQDLGGYLATITSQSETDFVQSNYGFLLNQGVSALWIGLTDEEVEGDFAWSDGTTFSDSQYAPWATGAPGTATSFPSSDDEDYVIHELTTGGLWNDIANEFWKLQDIYTGSSAGDAVGLAELTLNSSISLDSATEGSPLTTTFNLSAGTFNLTDLIEGANVYYKVTGIDSDDLDATTPNGLTGSGTIQNGQISLHFALTDDGIAENETFSITFYSDATLSDVYQIGSTASVDIVDSTPPAIIGTATSDAALTIISGDLIDPSVESYEVTTTGKGKKNKVTTGIFTPIEIGPVDPLDALVVNGDNSENTITANGFADNESTEIDETRLAFTGVLVIDGKGGADTIIGGASGTNWLIGGGTADGTVDTLTGVSLATDIFDLRKQDDESGENWSDAYSAGGHAEIKNYNIGDFIVLSGLSDEYQVINTTSVTETAKGKSGKTKSESTTIFEITKNGDLVAQIYGSDFDANSQSSDLNLIYGQSTGSLFDVVLNEARGQTILG